jgi:hypothetical protein
MAGSTDRRAAERLPVSPDTACSFVAPMAEDFGPGRIRDVSMAGVGLILVKRVEVGSLLAVGLTNPRNGFARTARVRVTHVTSVPGGYLVGGNFLEPLTYQELTAIVT